MIAPDGKVVEQVQTGDRVATNIAFGGPELKTAYITLSGKGELVAMDWPRGWTAAEFLEQVKQYASGRAIEAGMEGGLLRSRS